MTKSKKIIFSLDFSYLNLRLEWNSLRSFRNLFKFSSESVQIKKISSMNLFYSQGFIACVFENFVSIWSMKMQAYDGENLVPIAVPDIC